MVPVNLVTRWYWVDGEKNIPVSRARVKRAMMDESKEYKTDILDRFDKNGDGKLSQNELVLDSKTKVELMTGLLKGMGVKKPVIKGEVDAFPINHGIVGIKRSVRERTQCHAAGGRLGNKVLLSGYSPWNTGFSMLRVRGIR